MKRLVVIILVSFFLLANALALESACDLTVQMLNQDPYPAVPGDYVKLVFQVDGLQSTGCGDVTFQLLEKYPIMFDNATEKIISLKSGTFVRSFSSHATIAYKVRVDENALDGDNPIEVAYSTKGSNSFSQSKEFNLSVEDVRANFEVYVKSFDATTNDVTFEILNIAKSSVSAVTMELGDVENLKVYGSRTRIVGDLDSNEYTTSDFTIAPTKMEIPINVLYTDTAGIRRSTNAVVKFNPEDFAAVAQKSSPTKYYIIGIIVIALAYWLYRRNKNAAKRSYVTHGK
jgi:hypothetical protein